MFKRLSILSVVLILSMFTFGQNVSSSLKGVVVDPTGAVLGDATLTLTNQGTKTEFTAKTDASGSFTFLNVLGGNYSLEIKASGFAGKTLKDIAVEAAQVRTLGNIKLEIGSTSQVVVVTAESASIQLASAEKSGTVSGAQLDTLALRGRDMFALLGTIPGVVDTGASTRVISTPDQVAGTNINGNRDSSKNFTVDGITNLDTGSNQTVHFTVSSDAIEEVKVLTSNYGAEYGRGAGGSVAVITKSGTQSFHGTGYFYGRNESLNAMSWDAHHYDEQKQIERAGIGGFTLGGPIYIPGKLNTKRNKLFFFVSEEWSNWKQPASAKIVSVPTDLERQGDFSKSLDSTGTPIVVKNPATGQPFAGNLIPKEQISQLGQNILKFFPEPNYSNPQGSYLGNYLSQYSGLYKRRADMFRIDANISDTLSAYFRFNNDADQQSQPWGNWVTSMNWLLTPISFNQPGRGLSAHVTKVISPTLVNEFNFGMSHNHLSSTPSDASKWQRSQLGIPQWTDDTTYLPNISFGGRHYAPANINVIGSFPYENTNDIYSFVDNLSKILGKHSVKAGVYFERTGKVSPLWTTARGTLSFARSTLNPLDANDGFANALLGVVNSYSESTQGGSGAWWFNNLEGYVQDNWKVTPRLTLDFGLRIYHLGPVIDHNDKASTFDPALYDPAKAPRLYQSAINPGTNTKMGYDKITNAWVPSVAIGALVPGSGDFNNGSCQAGKNGCPEGLAENSAVDFGPRFGLAYDLFGNGKTALHLGGGVFKDRGSILPAVYSAGSSPVGHTSSAYYTTLDQLGAASGYRFPSGGSWTSGAWAFYGRMKTPTVTNYSASIQQVLPSSVVMDVSYVGGISRHLWVDKDINPITLGARLNPANAGAPNDNFMRTYPGYSDITAALYTGTANYNALQIKVDRKFKNNLQVGAAYSWSHTLGVTSGDGDYVSSYFNARSFNYGPLAYDRRHSLVVNYWYDLPKMGAKLNNRQLGWFTDNWSISGITSFIAGAPVTPSISADTYPDVTGSSNVSGTADSDKGMLIGNPHARAKGPAGQSLLFDPNAFAPTPVNTFGHPNFGNVPNGLLRGPGINNWDLTLAKRITFTEQRYVQLKGELFNVFNHTQYSTYDSGLVFHTNTDQSITQTNPTAGTYTSARDPRKMQLSVKLYF